MKSILVFRKERKSKEDNAASIFSYKRAETGDRLAQFSEVQGVTTHKTDRQKHTAGRSHKHSVISSKYKS
jgi:hypothetical protein